MILSALQTLLLCMCKMLVYAARCSASTVVLFYLSKCAWRWYILKSAEDRSSSLTKQLPLPPGSFGIPFLGETISWALEGSRFNFIRRKKYGKIFTTHFLGRAMVKVTGADNVRKILQGEHDIVTTIWPSTIRRIIGEHSIANSLGPEHKYKRRLAMRGFTHSALNSYIPDARKAISRKIKSWRNSSGPKKLYQEILQMTFEVASKAMAGITFKNSEEMLKLHRTFNEMIENLFSLPCDVPFSGFRKGLRAKDIIHHLLDEHLRKKVQRLHCNGNEDDADVTPENDAIQYILEGDLAESRKRRGRHDPDSVQSDSSDDEESISIPLEELKQSAVELMFAGYLTTGSSISSMIIQLTKHPEVMKKVEKELEEHGIINRSNPDEESEITLEKLQKLQYLEQVIKETLRVMPPTLGGYRKARKTFQIGGYRVPKDWTIIYNIRDTHEYEFEDDMEFNPSRFSREDWNEDRENRFRWLPFGGGPRVCIGKEFARVQIKLTVIEILRHFQDMKFHKDKFPPMFSVPTLHPTNGLPMVLTPR